MSILYPDSLPDGAINLWIEISASTATGFTTNKAVSASAARSLTAVTPGVVAYSPTVVALTTTSAGRGLTAVTPLSNIDVGVAQIAAARSVTSVTPSVLAIQPVALTTTAAARAVTAVVPVVETTSGSIAVSDNFNRANGAIGANWATPTGLTIHKISANTAIADTGLVATSYWVGDDFTSQANQYSELKTLGAEGAAAAVRTSASANTMYLARYTVFTDESSYDELILYKRVAGVETQLGTAYYGPADTVGSFSVVKIEVSGTSLTVRTATTHGGSYTSRITATDSAIASGSPGMDSVSGTFCEDFYGGTL